VHAARLILYRDNIFCVGFSSSSLCLSLILELTAVSIVHLRRRTRCNYDSQISQIYEREARIADCYT